MPVLPTCWHAGPVAMGMGQPNVSALRQGDLALLPERAEPPPVGSRS